jgi:hypothetical protein
MDVGSSSRANDQEAKDLLHEITTSGCSYSSTGESVIKSLRQIGESYIGRNKVIDQDDGCNKFLNNYISNCHVINTMVQQKRDILHPSLNIYHSFVQK